jgi:polyisoprenoid-binding protein YceI
VDAGALDRWLRAGGMRGLELGVPLAAMRSGKPALDRNMLRALRAAEFPEIRFRLTRSRVDDQPGDTVAVTADGVLSVAGHERDVTVAGRLVRSGAGVWLEGTHALRMSEYDVKPPTMMLGTLRVHDPVVVHFRLLLGAGTPAGRVPAASRHQERNAP